MSSLAERLTTVSCPLHVFYEDENIFGDFSTFNQEYNDVTKVTSNTITSASPQQRTSKEVGSKRMLCLKVIDIKYYKGTFNNYADKRGSRNAQFRVNNIHLK